MFIVQAKADLRPDLESSLQAEENHYTVDQRCIGRSIHIFGVGQCCISRSTCLSAKNGCRTYRHRSTTAAPVDHQLIILRSRVQIPPLDL